MSTLIIEANVTTVSQNEKEDVSGVKCTDGSPVDTDRISRSSLAEIASMAKTNVSVGGITSADAFRSDL